MTVERKDGGILLQHTFVLDDEGKETLVVSSGVPADATAADIAARLGMVWDAAWTHIPHANSQRLAFAKRMKVALDEKVAAARAAGEKIHKDAIDTQTRHLTTEATILSARAAAYPNGSAEG